MYFDHMAEEILKENKGYPFLFLYEKHNLIQ